MKKLAIYDFDGTLIDSPEPNPGKEIWKEKTGQEYPHKGWWGRKESLNTDVFEIKPFPRILFQFKKDLVVPSTRVIILTSRLEKLRHKLENVLEMNNIHPHEVIMKWGGETKGDVILKYVENNPDLQKIDVYDDFAGGMENKIREFTEIKDKLPENIEYNIYAVDNDKFHLMESKNNKMERILEEIRKINHQYL